VILLSEIRSCLGPLQLRISAFMELPLQPPVGIINIDRRLFLGGKKVMLAL